MCTMMIYHSFIRLMNEDVYGLFEDDRQYNSQTIEFIIRFNWLFKYKKYSNSNPRCIKEYPG